MLTSRSSTSVWKAARANIVPAMPDCPDDLSEPQYAVLMFGKGCHHCGRNLASIRTVWLARRRICKRCIDEHCSLSFPDEYMRNIVPLKRYLPKIEVSRKPSTYYFVEYASSGRKPTTTSPIPKRKNPGLYPNAKNGRQ
ncbi:hypothetical protein BJ912DRAFT_400491 [Pholiota molesta]|nr:hypothetical protein BJ912DRAFT_400491 [Pholiota molesta]